MDSGELVSKTDFQDAYELKSALNKLLTE